MYEIKFSKSSLSLSWPDSHIQIWPEPRWAKFRNQEIMYYNLYIITIIVSL